MRDRSKVVSEMRSMLTGRIVDSYTNILTVKLFARAQDEDDYVREAVDYPHRAVLRSLRLNTAVRAVAGAAQRDAGHRHRRARAAPVDPRQVAVGTVAMALPLAWQIINIAGWVAAGHLDLRECRRRCRKA